MTSWTSCPTCHGLGRIRPDGEAVPCPRCRGEKWVKLEPAKIFRATDPAPVAQSQPSPGRGVQSGGVLEPVSAPSTSGQRRGAGIILLCLFAATAHAAAVRDWVRDQLTPPPVVIPTNAPPPVITNAPPPVATNAPPVVTNAPPVASEWKTELLWSRPLPWKGKTIETNLYGQVFTTYKKDTRKDAEIHIRIKGVVQTALYRGPEETIGQELIDDPDPWLNNDSDYVAPLGATAFNGDLYFHAENGKNVLILKGEEVVKGPAMPSGMKWNITTTLYKGRPVIAGVGQGTKTLLMDAANGSIIWTAPWSALVAQMIEVDGELWMACSDGDWGLRNRSGLVDKTHKPASIAHTPALGLLIGGMDEGTVWRRTHDGAWDLVADLKCSKINMLVPWGDSVLVAGSKPDTFAVIYPHTYPVVKVEQIARYEDEKVEKSGQQFDACIATESATSVLYGRETPKGAEFYRAWFGAKPSEPTPPAIPPTPTPPPTVGKCPDPASNVQGHGLFKPCGVSSESGALERPRLWMQPDGVKAEDIAHAGEYTPDGELVQWFCWPGSSTGHPMNNKPINGLNLVTKGNFPSDWYYGGRLKFRCVSPVKAGNILRSFRKGDGKEICRLVVQDPTRRHEGKSKL